MWVLIVQRIISIVLCLSSLENKINLIFNVLFFLVKLASKRGEGGSCTLTPVSLVVGIHFVISQLHILYYSTKALIPRFIFQAKWRNITEHAQKKFTFFLVKYFASQVR